MRVGESRVGALALTEEDAAVRTWEGGPRFTGHCQKTGEKVGHPAPALYA